MGFQAVTAKGAHRPLGHYSQAIRAGEFLFVAGQTPRHPETGAIPETFRDQVIQVLDSLKAILEAGGTSLKFVTRVSVYLGRDDDEEFDVMNSVFAEYFCRTPPPARTTIQAGIGQIGIEIDAIAWIPGASD